MEIMPQKHRQFSGYLLRTLHTRVIGRARPQMNFLALSCLFALGLGHGVPVWAAGTTLASETGQAGVTGSPGSAGALQDQSGGTGGDGASVYSNLNATGSPYMASVGTNISGGNGGDGGAPGSAGNGGIGGTGGNGGTAISGAGFVLTNDGAMTGGTGGVGGIGLSGDSSSGFGGNGGAAGTGGTGGTAISGTGFTLTNESTGSIVGGTGGAGGIGGVGSAGWSGGYGGAGGSGGTAIDGAGFTITNDGSITGGRGGNGGNGGNGGSGSYTDFGAGGSGGNGGTAVSGESFRLTNGGSITGGAAGSDGGGAGGVGTGGVGGTAIDGMGFTLMNEAAGLITGGAGGGSGAGGNGGTGGTAISGTGFILTNNGSITGGSGGAGGAGDGNFIDAGAGGNGGVAITGDGFTLTNNGSITGGNGTTGAPGGGYNPQGAPGVGGVGVISTGNATVTNAGTISGGKANFGTGTQADAVDFSGGGNTLVLGNGYQFNGTVASTSGTANGGDTLALGGQTAANFDLSQIGSSAQYQGFNTFGSAASNTATWTLTGALASGNDQQWNFQGGTVVDNGSGGPIQGTTISGGLLMVGDASHSSASLNGPVAVMAGGTLRGHGTINGNVTNSGTVHPGGSIGMLTIHGNYVQNSAGTLNISVTPNDTTPGTDYDQLNVMGTAALNGNLKVLQDSGSFGNYTVGAKYQIVHASQGISGSFSQVSYNPLFSSYITPQVTTGTNDVTLTLTATSPTPTPVPSDLSDYRLFSSGRGVSDSLFITNASGLMALNTLMDGAGKTGSSTVGFTNSRQGPWGKVFGGFGQANQADMKHYGAVAGYGVAIHSNLAAQMVVGGAVVGASTKTTTDQQTVNGQSFGGFGYAIATEGNLRISATTGAGGLQQNSTRYLYPSTVQASGQTHGWYAGLGVQGQYLIPMDQAFLVPYGRLNYLHTQLNGFAEQGAGNLNIQYGDLSTNLAAMSAGLRLGYGIDISGYKVIPWVSVGGTGYAGDRQVTQAQTVGLLNSQQTAVVAPGGALNADAGISFLGLSSPWTVKLNYRGQFAHGAHLNTFEVLANYRW